MICVADYGFKVVARAPSVAAKEYSLQSVFEAIERLMEEVQELGGWFNDEGVDSVASPYSYVAVVVSEFKLTRSPGMLRLSIKPVDDVACDVWSNNNAFVYGHVYDVVISIQVVDESYGNHSGQKHKMQVTWSGKLDKDLAAHSLAKKLADDFKKLCKEHRS